MRSTWVVPRSTYAWLDLIWNWEICTSWSLIADSLAQSLQIWDITINMSSNLHQRYINQLHLEKLPTISCICLFNSRVGSNLWMMNRIRICRVSRGLNETQGHWNGLCSRFPRPRTPSTPWGCIKSIGLLITSILSAGDHGFFVQLTDQPNSIFLELHISFNCEVMKIIWKKELFGYTLHLYIDVEKIQSSKLPTLVLIKVGNLVLIWNQNCVGAPFVYLVHILYIGSSRTVETTEK